MLLKCNGSRTAFPPVFPVLAVCSGCAPHLSWGRSRQGMLESARWTLAASANIPCFHVKSNASLRLEGRRSRRMLFLKRHLIVCIHSLCNKDWNALFTSDFTEQSDLWFCGAVLCSHCEIHYIYLILMYRDCCGFQPSIELAPYLVQKSLLSVCKAAFHSFIHCIWITTQRLLHFRPSEILAEQQSIIFSLSIFSHCH